MTTHFVAAGSPEDFAEGKAVGLVLDGWPVLVARSEGKLFATIDRCTHAASALSTGRVRRGAVMCPLHGARFELATGRCVGGTYKPLILFEVREEGDAVSVAVPEAAPGPEQLPITTR